MRPRLQARRAVVTGGARGIGRAAVERLLLEGAAVASVDLDASSVDGAIGLQADVSDEAALVDAFAEVRAALGGLDLLVVNAAVQRTHDEARAHELDAAVWRATLEVNLTGAYLTAKHGIGAMLAEDRTAGSVVLVGSAAGAYGIARGLDAYSASKAGVNGLVRVLAADYAGDGIRVNGVLPGLTRTAMNHWWLGDAEREAEALRAVPLGRVAEPEEIAAVVAFLASDDASYVTGALWAVDGGLTAV